MTRWKRAAPSRPGAASWVAAVVAVILLAGAASLYFIGTRGPQSTGTTASFTLTSTTAQSPGDGLTLSLALNATALSSGQSVTATVGEANKGSAPVNVSAAARWPVGGLGVSPCGALNYPAGVAVLAGNFDASNVSSATALEVYQPGLASCPMILSGIEGFLFQASSDNATVYGSCSPPPGACLSETVETSLSFAGYWRGGSFESFPPGTYTVVAGDEWGGLAILHFMVR